MQSFDTVNSSKLEESRMILYSSASRGTVERLGCRGEEQVHANLVTVTASNGFCHTAGDLMFNYSFPTLMRPVANSILTVGLLKLFKITVRFIWIS